MGHAATLFSGQVDQTLITRISPTAEQREFLQQQWNDMAEHLKRELAAQHGYPISTWLQGSYKFGTLIKPVHHGEEYDVDVGIYFEWEDEDAEPTPWQLRQWVQDELLVYESLCDELRAVEEPKERCSRASYIKQFHIDTPTYHLAPGEDRRRLATLSNKWGDSDPKAIYKWFRDALPSSDRDQVRRLVRYMKSWAAVSFDDSPKSRPSSIVLTVLVTQAYQNMVLTRFIGIADDDALIEIVKAMHDRLFANKTVSNPIDESEDLNRMDEEAWQGFLPRLDALRDVAERAKESDDEAAAALIWTEAFSFLMPLPEVAEVEMLEQASGRAVMQLPEIEVSVYAPDVRAPDKRRLIAKHRNEVPSVTKDCMLAFKIVNPHVVPEYATIEWTVRNEGEEADTVSDLGHRRMGMRMLQADGEFTAYAGRHFMDCVIRLNGTVYAVRRVPVIIKDISRPLRNPSKPTYTKLRKFLRRRR